MTPLLEGIQTEHNRYHVAARPEVGIPVTLYVVPVVMPRKGVRWHVKRNPDSSGHVSYHTTFEAAVKSANARAKRYLGLCHKAAKRRAA